MSLPTPRGPSPRAKRAVPDFTQVPVFLAHDSHQSRAGASSELFLGFFGESENMFTLGILRTAGLRKYLNDGGH